MPSYLLSTIYPSTVLTKVETVHYFTGWAICAQIPIGKVKVQEGVQKGRFRAIQQRCRYYSIAERYEEKNRPDQKQGAIRTTYCCVIHKDVYMCKQGLRTCWQEHLAACKPATT